MQSGPTAVLRPGQWRRIIEAARAEAETLAPDRYGEVKYEHFVAEPTTVMSEVGRWCGLQPSSRPASFIRRHLELRDMNYHWRDALSATEAAMLSDLLEDLLRRLGYEIEAPTRPLTGPVITTPFDAVSLSGGGTSGRRPSSCRG
jgi:hypothetical protein